MAVTIASSSSNASSNSNSDDDGIRSTVTVPVHEAQLFAAARPACLLPLETLRFLIRHRKSRCQAMQMQQNHACIVD